MKPDCPNCQMKNCPRHGVSGADLGGKTNGSR